MSLVTLRLFWLGTQIRELRGLAALNKGGSKMRSKKGPRRDHIGANQARVTRELGVEFG